MAMRSRSGSQRKTYAVGLAVGVIGMHAAPALANGRFPEANQIVFSPSNPDVMALRATYGILPSHDHGATWQYVCNDVLGLAFAPTDPSVALTGSDSLLAGVSLGLDVSADMGCDWSCIGGGLANQSIVDLAVRPDTPSSAVAITGTFSALPDSGQEVSFSQVFETIDNGATWAAIGAPIDPAVTVETIDVTKTDPNRLYVSGTRGYASARTASLFMSRDKGATWTEWPLPPTAFDPNLEDSIYIGAIDPTNADKVYLRSSPLLTGGVSRLTVATFPPSGAPTFASPYAFDAGPDDRGGLTGPMLGMALSEDGSTVYIGSVEDGLYRAQASDLAFQHVSSIHVQCLATHGQELWACSDAVSGFIAGVSTDGGNTFTAKMATVGSLSPSACAANDTMVACGQQTNGAVCAGAFETFCQQELCEAPGSADGGSGEGGGGDAGSAGSPGHGPASASSSCALTAPGRGGAAGVSAGLALAGLALARRRKR
jgi:hypothetical protein